MYPSEDFIGRKFGRLTVVALARRDKRGNRYWSCRCNCTSEGAPLKEVRQDFLLSGRVSSCGCRRSELMRGNQRQASQSRGNEPQVAFSVTANMLQSKDNASLIGDACSDTVFHFLKGEDGAGKSSPSTPITCPHGKELSAIDMARDDGRALFCGICKRDRKWRLTLITPSALPKCQHGVLLISGDVARGDGCASYCEACGVHHEQFRGDQKEWNQALSRENLSTTRGIGMTTETSSDKRARKLAQWADQTSPAGKRFVTAGGSREVEFTAARDTTVEQWGGKRRIAEGFDKVAPWQNPNIDIDETGDSADSSLVNHIEKGHTEIDRPLDGRKYLSGEDGAKRMDSSNSLMRIKRKQLKIEAMPNGRFGIWHSDNGFGGYLGFYDSRKEAQKAMHDIIRENHEEHDESVSGFNAMN